MTNEAGYLIVFIRNLHSLLYIHPCMHACTDQGEMGSAITARSLDFFLFFCHADIYRTRFASSFSARWITSSIRECAWCVPCCFQNTIHRRYNGNILLLLSQRCACLVVARDTRDSIETCDSVPYDFGFRFIFSPLPLPPSLRNVQSDTRFQVLIREG